ncbi:hypothetical protein NG798_04845 [Ancylothrix sp. C2]|uniref:hypothetical protein n=1 Tax=Ancylothrix sp. D3o TaxID=2953691 RepID=UPI0021BB2110|nr:hypothetical protein [Ancylothrix sp. D3o]MCT7949106.1 hypothetical protein [Ancylothrix sp. D3o]
MEINKGNVKFKFIPSDFLTFTVENQFSLMNLNKKPALRFGGISILLGAILGCGSFAQNMPVTNIADIRQNRSNYSTIYLKGRVENQAPFLGTGAYQVRDETGSIWVFTTQSLPNKGDEILLKGEVQYKSIPLAGQDLGEVYIDELEQVKRLPVEKK